MANAGDCILEKIIEIRSLVTQHPEAWTELGFKCRLMTLLEQAACTMEHNFPRKLRSGDAATDRWILQRCEAAAARIRALKMWSITPFVDTRDRLIARVSQALAHVLLNDWYSFESESKHDLDILSGKPTDVSPAEADGAKPKRGRKRVLTQAFVAAVRVVRRTLSTVIIAFLPLGALLAGSQVGLLPQATEGYTTLGVFLAIAGIMSRVDPLFKDQVAMASTMLGRK
jgi:hypothetical protein